MQPEVVAAAAAFVGMFGLWVVLPTVLRRRAESRSESPEA